jgi:hypothetical protein
MIIILKLKFIFSYNLLKMSGEKKSRGYISLKQRLSSKQTISGPYLQALKQFKWTYSRLDKKIVAANRQMALVWQEAKIGYNEISYIFSDNIPPNK